MSEINEKKEITIEMVDAVMERVPFISTREAKEALEANNGDVVDTIIYFEESEEYDYYYEDVDDFDFTSEDEESEKSAKKKFNEKVNDMKGNFGQDIDNIKNNLAELLKKTNVIRIKVEKNGKSVINLPLTLGVIGIAAMPLLTLFGLSAAVLSKYSVKISDETSEEEVDLGKLDTEKLDILKEMLLNSFNEIKDTFKKDDEVAEGTEVKETSVEDEVVEEAEEKQQDEE